MSIKYLSVLLVTMLLLSACGDGGTGSAVIDDQVVLLKITPESTILARVNDSHQLQAQAFNAVSEKLNKNVSWRSSNPNIVSVDESGMLASMGTVGSATVVAEVDGVESSPATILVVETAINARFIDDNQIMGDYVQADPAADFAIGARYKVTLTGIEAPTIGTILIAREDQPVAGRVVDVNTLNEQLVVTLEMLPLNELFPDLNIDQTFVASKDDITISKEAAEYYSMEQQVDGSYVFTLLPGTPAIRADGRIATAERATTTSRSVAIGTVANPFHPFDCTFTGPSFSGGNQIFSIPALSQTIVLSAPLPTLTVVYTSATGLQKLILKGQVKSTSSIKSKFSAQLEGKAECKLKLQEIKFPFPGALALIIGAQTPIGIGFEASGKITLADMEIGAIATAKLDAEFGLTYPAVNNSHFISNITPSGELKPIINLPPVNSLTADLTFEPAMSAFGYADLTFGNPIIDAWRITLANLQAGVKQNAKLALVETQIGDAGLKSNYQLSLELSARPASDLTGFLGLLGVPSTLVPSRSSSIPLTTSPTVPTPVAQSITADVENFLTGDVVNFTVKLDPDSVNYIPGVYNVDEILIYQNRVAIGVNGPELVARVTATDNQTEFNIDWVATNDGSVTDKFYAFVSTDLLPLPLLGELELGKVTPPQAASIVFMSDRDGNQEIYRMNIDGSNQTRLTQNAAQDSIPSWSPDGSRIAFSRDGQIYAMNADGSNQVALTQNPSFNYYVDWSPDGSKIAFLDLGMNGNQEIYLMNADGSNRVNLTQNPANDWFPAWSPDGSKTAFTSHRYGPSGANIFSMNADGSNQVNLTPGPLGAGEFSWSPDGSKIVYQSQAFSVNTGFNDEIFVMNADGSSKTKLTNNINRVLGAIDYPVWSPDGSKIYFKGSQGGNNGDIFSMNADGSNQTNLTQTTSFESSPSISPDGLKIYFTSERNSNMDIYVRNSDGSNEVNLTQNPAYDAQPNWSP